MKYGRGRYSQYKLLHEEKKIRNYLVETVLFSKKSLFCLLGKYKAVVIKPSFGPGEFNISFENNKYKIKTQKKIITVINKEEVYEYIKSYEIHQKFYVIQPRKLASSQSPIPYRSIVTVHRKTSSAKWRIVSTAYDEDFSVFSQFYHRYYLKKFRRASIIAAKKLGESFTNYNTIVIEILFDYKRGFWISDTILHSPVSKWDQYQTLRVNKTILSFLPKTNLLTNVTFRDYLNRFNEIMIKPCSGQHGVGIVQIKRKNPFTYEIHSGIRSVTITNQDRAYSYIEDTFLSKKDYIVQQKIQLATIDMCPMDVRVITSKVESAWIVTDKIVKVAGANFIITNAAQKLLTLEDAIQDSTISNINNEKLEAKIDKICLLAAKHLEKSDAELTIIGFDIGITNQGDIWIIEGNYVPDLSMFKDHKEKQR
ncbi:YheC/YheD family protein [Psychrobacillus sp. NPDC058041]|uniref:YheC/YheD family protein n=1 Tax=Psychrobacillus sp. NPDC058041 TaxID=3346310 RepID=UPI0036DB1239